jgi:hypothetical protein
MGMQQVVVARESRKKADMALQQEHKERDMAERKALEEGLRRAQAERRAHEESMQRAAAEQRELDAQVRSSIEKQVLKDTEHARRLWVAESQRLEALLQASEAKRQLAEIEARNASASSSTTVEAPRALPAPQELEATGALAKSHKQRQNERRRAMQRYKQDR